MNSHSNSEKWLNISTAGRLPAKQAFYKVWFEGKALTPQETLLLRQIYQKYPMNAPDFNTWLKMTVRQIFENYVAEKK